MNVDATTAMANCHLSEHEPRCPDKVHHHRLSVLVDDCVLVPRGHGSQMMKEFLLFHLQHGSDEVFDIYRSSTKTAKKHAKQRKCR